jgi:DNA-binding transcriptional regulator YbjK
MTGHGPEQAEDGGVRERILDAALAVLRAEGLRQFTQVRVAQQAGVRQSHLTYYFPTRHDLLEGTTTRFVEGLARGIGHLVGDEAGRETMLERLARAVTDPGHMRMFVGVIVAADTDPEARAIVVRGTRAMEAALAAALGGEGAAARARVVLASLWGLGLYEFVVRPDAADAPTALSLAWLDRLVADAP